MPGDGAEGLIQQNTSDIYTSDINLSGVELLSQNLQRAGAQ